MSDTEAEVWEEVTREQLGEESTEHDAKLQGLINPRREEMPRSSGMHGKSPQDLLPRVQY